MALKFRDVKGTPLTHAEVDGNFRHFTSSYEISGSVTASGLLITGSGQTDTVYINNGHISASGDISASGTVYATNFQSPGSSSIQVKDDLNVSGHITASGNISGSSTSTLTLGGAANLGGALTASGLLLTDPLSQQAFGTISASGDITASNLFLSGDADITGNITLGGNMTGGDSSTDSIALNADIISNITPNADDTYDLGTESKRWQDIHGTAINAQVLALNAITASGTSTLAAAQHGIWIGPFSISGTVDIGAGSNFVISSFNRLDQMDLLNYSDY